MEELTVVGKSVPRLDAVEKVTGRAKFGSDFKMGGMLYAKVLRSPYPHAKILLIDTSRAEKLPGVRAVIGPRDVPLVPIGPLLGDQFELCSHDNIVRCVGDPVAAVAADTIDIAEEALELIEVKYEELPAIFDGEEAFGPDLPVIIHPELPNYQRGPMPVRPDPERPNVCQTYRLISGDVEKGFQEADLVVENRFTTARIQHCQIEGHLATVWFESDGSLTVSSPCHLPWTMKSLLSRFFNLPPSKIRVLTPYVGGAFGGKGWVRAELIAGLLARKSGRPVRLLYTRQDMFVRGGNRAPVITYIKDGVKRDGTLVAREMKVFFVLGAYGDWGILLVRRSAAAVVGTYRVPNLRLDAYGVYTNEPLTTALRGLGAPEVQWPIEQQMDIIAERLGLDPVEIRRKNILNEGDRDASGMITRSIGVRQCLDKVAEWIGLGEKPVEEAEPWKKGKGIAIGNKSIIAGSTSVVTLKVWQDGMIEVRHSSVELGQGINTSLAQIAAEEFGVPVDRIRVVSGDTAFCPFDFGTISSRSLIHNGNALILACRDAKQQLFKMAATKLRAAPEDIATSNGKVYVKSASKRSINITDLFTPLGIPLQGGEILGRGLYTGPVMPEDPETGQSDRSVFDYTYMASAVEVAVNVQTGDIKVLRSATACDLGKAVNPKIAEQQIEGGLVMGIGSALYEEVVLDKGTVVNTSFMDYHIPRTMDIPRGKDNKTIMVEVAEPEGPFGAKGVGELTMTAIAPALASAVYNAIGVRIKDLPLSKEKVLEGIQKLQSVPLRG